MAEISPNEWGEAFAAYSLDAATGRLFRGLAHNINGVAQAFSMQTELLQMLFAQAAGLLSQGENAASLAEAQEVCRKLKVLLERRASLTVHLEREVKVVQAIMQRCSALVAAAGDAPGVVPFTLSAVVETELEFMAGDGFFKHKVKKELALPQELPPLRGFLVEIHQILFILLENAAQSLQVAAAAGQGAPLLTIGAVRGDQRLQLAISDNGEGIAPEQLSRIFDPFYTTRPGRLGVGLWLARRLAGRFGGEIGCESHAGRTTFTLDIPFHGDGDVGR
ncbi:MAG TPA: sensor histidine kinase [Desulfurivibrionaceae bacterium]|nr:sensor histidine kinase [Desulfurivibrionaceae bacterium]